MPFAVWIHLIFSVDVGVDTVNDIACIGSSDAVPNAEDCLNLQAMLVNIERTSFTLSPSSSSLLTFP